jgi:hypothetical protein
MAVGNYQEAKFKNASYKNNKKRKVKKEGKFFVFLANFQKQRELFSFFLTKNPP